MPELPARVPPERVREILDLALERPTTERQAFVAGACAGQADLRDEVLSLLTALDGAGHLLEPAAPAARPPAEPLTGLRFGAYTVGARIGAGGMGVVYEARDTRLGRTVAVKALPPSLSADPHRRARFEQEARLVASLMHPNIGAIFGVEDTARGPVMVLEHVPGPTLAQRLEGGLLPIDEALHIARQIARALEAAHGAGIVHRDLKPANVKLTPEGTAKVLDFGVATVIGPVAIPAPESAATATTPATPGAPHRHTRDGDMIGTAAYMSPEQARGRPVDRRSDMWAFGCVLFEMLTGRRAFEGETTSDTIAAVLRGGPDWTVLPASTPAPAARLLRRCLEKDPDARQRDAGDARLDLEEKPEAGAPTGRSRRRAVLLAVTALAAVAGGTVTAGFFWGGRGPGLGAPATPARFTLELPQTSRLWMSADGGMALSPDGRTLVYSAGPSTGPRLYLRPIDGFEAAPIAGTENGVQPFFAPDGRNIGFHDEGFSKIFRVPLAGGAPTLLNYADDGALGTGSSWGRDGSIVYAPGTGVGLHRLSDAGGEPQVLTRLAPGELSHAQPEVLPSAKLVLFSCCTQTRDEISSRIEVLDTASGSRRVLLDHASQARFVEPDTLLYFQTGKLMAASFDAGAARITGPARPVLEGLAADEPVPWRRYAVSRNGRTLAYLPGTTTYLHASLTLFGMDGSSRTLYRANGAVDGPRFSPDGRRIAMVAGLREENIWVHDLERGGTTVLTVGKGAEYPVWSPDGRRVLYRNWKHGEPIRLESAPADGSAPPEVLWSFAAGGYPTCFTPDGRALLVTAAEPGWEHEDIAVLPLNPPPPPGTLLRRLIEPPAHRLSARFSPDGSLLLYTSNETGRLEVYLQPYPALDRKIPVSVDGGYRPAWADGGKRILYRFLDRVYAADVETMPELKISMPRLVLEHLPDARFDAAPDGGVVMGCPSGGWEPQRRINVVVGWDGVKGSPAR